MARPYNIIRKQPVGEPRDHPQGFPGGCCPTSRHQSPVMLVPSCHSERSEESHPRLITLPQASRPGPFFQRRHPGPPFAEPSLVSLVASPVSCPCLRTEILRFAQNDRLFPLCHSCVREAGVLFPLRNAVGAVPVARMSVPFRWIPAKNCGNDRGQSAGMTGRAIGGNDGRNAEHSILNSTALAPPDK